MCVSVCTIFRFIYGIFGWNQLCGRTFVASLLCLTAAATDATVAAAFAPIGWSVGRLCHLFFDALAKHPTEISILMRIHFAYTPSKLN